MTTDDTGQSDPSGLPVSGDGEQLPGELLGQPQDRKPELDAYGLPVQYQPAKGRIILGAISWLITIAIPILGAVGAGIAITYVVSHHKLASHLVGLGNAASWPAGILAFVVPIWAWTVEKNKHRGAIVSIVLVGGLLGLIGMVILTGPPNCPC